MGCRFHLIMNICRSLHIFQEQGHPNIFRQAKRESLSLFGILNFSQTQAGKMLLKQWIMRPLLDLDTIKERHDSIEWFIQQDLSSRKMLQDSLRRLRNIPKLLRAMNSKLSLADWQALHQVN
ncbi:hypothetical protein QVD99_007744 [Batrachochytrium dendrobatidis]|nr:hypothetical protein QVD99_007744 [Batrachochytrium dendrobatidis]